MKLSSSKELHAESKVIILYVLDKINEPVTDSELLQVVSSVSDINYFYFKQFLLDLIGSKYVIEYEKENTVFYKLTPEGKKVLDLTISILPGILKLRVDTGLQNCLKDIQNKTAVIADFYPDDNNMFYVDCKIVEKNEVLFSMHVFAGSRDQAKLIVDNWKENAIKLYPNIIDIITKN